MSEEEAVLSDDLKKQIAKLDGIAEAAEKNLRPAMERATSMLLSAVEPNVPSLTGLSRASLETRITGSGLDLSGTVGWNRASGKRAAWWINIVEYGAREHDLTPKATVRSRSGMHHFQEMKSLGFAPTGRHVLVNGQWKTIGIHPGFSGRFMLSNAYERNQEDVSSIFSNAMDQTLQELSVNA
jgi:HK97 gp10 family phage protein